jgi:hypothetical protein
MPSYASGVTHKPASAGGRMSYTKYVCIMAHYAKDYKARTAPSL